MADILYTYKNQVYVNLTNKCDCACTFCIRSHQDSVGDSADTLWHKTDPGLEEVTAALMILILQVTMNWCTAAMANRPVRWIS